jgi:murein DD-endopeptidase MepM/ murein hydrolase activator NlpD
LLIAFTPLKKLVPGYQDIKANAEFIELRKKTKAFEQQIAEFEIYLEGNKRRLMGVGDSTLEMPLEETSQTGGINLEDFMKNNDNQEELAFKVRHQSNSLSGNYFFLAPVNGTISYVFDPSIKHFGIDILAPKNTPIKAIMDGFVISSDWTLETGNTICVQHPNNTISFYKHNSVLLKKTGDYVRAGEALAIIGNSGTLSDGPHLHFELWIQGQCVNPLEYIEF